MRYKVQVVVVVLIAMLLVLASQTACAPSGGEATGGATGETMFKWRMSGGDAEDTPTSIRQKMMADLVRERTEGGLDITPYYSAVLGDWSAMNEMVMRGDVEILSDALDSAFDPRLAVSYYMPYLVTSYEEAKSFYAYDSTLFNITYDVMEPLGYIPLGALCRGISGCSFKGEPISPGDPDVAKPYKIRIMPLKQCRLTYERLGYLTTAIPWGEAYSSIQTGICDGQMGGGYFQATYFKDITDTYVGYNDYIEHLWFAVNQDAYNSLPAEYQGILLDACQEVCLNYYDEIQQDELQFKQVLEDWDIEVIELTPAELEECALAVRTDVWPQLEDMIGRDIIQKLYDELGVAY